MHLLAHELVHWLQQRGSSTAVIQRAETDTRATILSGTTLIDTVSDVNARINKALRNARITAKGKPELVIQGLFMELGVNGSVGRTKIEDWAGTLGSKKVHLPPKGTTKYKGAEYNLWYWASLGRFPILNPTMLINGIYVGSDKLGHFLQQGHEYYKIAKTRGKKGIEAAEKYGLGTEKGGFGLKTTGVLSHGDLEANRQGLKFYQQLESNPNMTFDFKNYINIKWNERHNPSHYIEAVGRYVWANLLGTRNWKGTIKEKGNSTNVVVKMKVSIPSKTSKTLNLTGEFTFRQKTGGSVTGKIVKGDVTFLLSAHKAVRGVVIKFDWQLSKSSGSKTPINGKGKLESTGETQLNGTWGSGLKDNDRGKWNLVK